MKRLLIIALTLSIFASTTMHTGGMRSIYAYFMYESSTPTQGCCSVESSSCSKSTDNQSSPIADCCTDVCHCTCCLHILIASILENQIRYIGDVFDERFAYASPKCYEYSSSIFIPPING